LRLRAWRFVTLTLAALSMGMAWAHALELGPKMALPESDYILVQGIYQEFGRLGAVIEPAAILTFLARGRHQRSGSRLPARHCWRWRLWCGLPS
jgi:hypothetical protein